MRGAAAPRARRHVERLFGALLMITPLRAERDALTPPAALRCRQV